MKVVTGQWSAVGVLFALMLFISDAGAQNKAALIATEKNPTSARAAEKMEAAFAAAFKILDASLAETVFRSQNFETPFNLTTEQARNLGRAIGGDLYLLVKAETIARTSLEKGTYREAYAAVFAVSARSGKLLHFELVKAEAPDAKAAETKLLSTLDLHLRELVTKIQSALAIDFNEPSAPRLAEPPGDGSPEAKNFRAPIPFRRIKPEYTLLANLYSVTATVDVSVDVGADGKILRTELLRWAGYGLDEAVTETIRRMNWRAAERDGKPLPIRVLLRYNFRKIESVE